VIEWPDFDGFGFSVNTLRDIPGQFVGKVDTGSPAAAAGSYIGIASITYLLTYWLLHLWRRQDLVRGGNRK